MFIKKSDVTPEQWANLSSSYKVWKEEICLHISDRVSTSMADLDLDVTNTSYPSVIVFNDHDVDILTFTNEFDFLIFKNLKMQNDGHSPHLMTVDLEVVEGFTIRTPNTNSSDWAKIHSRIIKHCFEDFKLVNESELKSNCRNDCFHYELVYKVRRRLRDLIDKALEIFPD